MVVGLGWGIVEDYAAISFSLGDQAILGKNAAINYDICDSAHDSMGRQKPETMAKFRLGGSGLTKK